MQRYIYAILTYMYVYMYVSRLLIPASYQPSSVTICPYFTAKSTIGLNFTTK